MSVFTNLPTLATGGILTASWLNTLSDNCEYLFGTAVAANFPFTSYSEVELSSDAILTYWLRHRMRYLYWDFYLASGTSDDAKIAIDGNLPLNDTANQTATYTWNNSGAGFDMNGYSLTDNQWYAVTVTLNNAGSAEFYLKYLYESDNASPTTAPASSSWAVPARWEHGDYPTAANMNTYKSALDTVHRRLGDDQTNHAVAGGVSSGVFWMVNRYSWLHFLSDGEIVDPTGSGASVSLSDGGASSPVAYDISNVSWMYPGKRYYVSGCSFACEEYAN